MRNANLGKSKEFRSQNPEFRREGLGLRIVEGIEHRAEGGNFGLWNADCGFKGEETESRRKRLIRFEAL